MSDAHAPVAAPPAAVTTTTTPPPAKPKDVAPAWNDKDDADLIERVKRSPYGKFKADGKDEHIDSPDAFKRLILDAQRGKGANRVVEQTKKEAAEAKKVADEAKAERELVKRARAGDVQARRELGLIPDEERQRSEQEWEALPPEVKALVQQNHEMSQRLRQAEEAQKAELAERESLSKKQKRDETLKKAKEYLPQVMADIKEEFYDAELPSVIMAMETLKDSSLRLGVDYTVEQLRTYVEQQRQGGVDERISRMKPDVALKRLAPILKGLKPAELQQHLGDDFVPLAKLFSAQWIAHNKASRNKPAPAQSSQQAEQPREKPAPLSPMRFVPRGNR